MYLVYNFSEILWLNVVYLHECYIVFFSIIILRRFYFSSVVTMPLNFLRDIDGNMYLKDFTLFYIHKILIFFLSVLFLTRILKFRNKFKISFRISSE